MGSDDSWVDSVKIERIPGYPAGVQELPGGRGKTSTYLGTRSVRNEVLCVSCKGDSQERKTQYGRTGFSLHGKEKTKFFLF